MAPISAYCLASPPPFGSERAEGRRRPDVDCKISSNVFVKIIEKYIIYDNSSTERCKIRLNVMYILYIYLLLFCLLLYATVRNKVLISLLVLINLK